MDRARLDLFLAHVNVCMQGIGLLTEVENADPLDIVLVYNQTTRFGQGQMTVIISFKAEDTAEIYTDWTKFDDAEQEYAHGGILSGWGETWEDAAHAIVGFLKKAGLDTTKIEELKILI